MKFLKILGFLALFTAVLATGATAQEDVKTYIAQTDPIISQLQKNVEGFMSEVQPLREKKDIVGLKNTADKYITVWTELMTELEKVQAPADAAKHYEALSKLLEMQRESNKIMSETLGERITLILAVQKMKKDGATEDEQKAYIQKNTPSRDELVAKTSAVKTATEQADATLKAERDRLVAKVKSE